MAKTIVGEMFVAKTVFDQCQTGLSNRTYKRTLTIVKFVIENRQTSLFKVGTTVCLASGIFPSVRPFSERKKFC
jgi:hypothetical protein